jgi:hypothetical protein
MGGACVIDRVWCAECGGEIVAGQSRFFAHRWRRLGSSVRPVREILELCSQECLEAREAANKLVRIGRDDERGQNESLPYGG